MNKLKELRKQHSTLDGDHTKLKRDHEYTTERLEILMKQCESDAEEMGRMRQQKANMEKDMNDLKAELRDLTSKF